MDFVAEALELLRSLYSAVVEWVIETAKANSYLVFIAIATLVRATGVTVQSGTTGLMFSFGRARKIVPPGFQLLIPFLQVVRVVPTRQRTLDLPAQRVTTFDGLVYLVDANLVYRVADVRKALIEIDDLAKGMRQMLVLSVQDVLRDSERAAFQASALLDRKLSESMARRLAQWGVEVESAGFTSITPSPKTSRLTQLAERVAERRRGLAVLERGAARPLALALLGTNQRVLSRAVLGREREILGRRRNRVERMFRRAEPALVELDFDDRARARLRRELFADAGLGGVLGDAGFGHDEKAKTTSERNEVDRRAQAKVKAKAKAKRPPERSPTGANPTRVRRSPTGRKPTAPLSAREPARR